MTALLWARLLLLGALLVVVAAQLWAAHVGNE
jgi:hypothetical protein